MADQQQNMADIIFQSTGGRRRSSTNWYAFLLSALLLLVTLELSNGQPVTSGIRKITTDINKALNVVLEDLDNIKYDEIRQNLNMYNSSTTFDPKGMRVLYNATAIFIKLLFPTVVPPEVSVANSGRIVIQNDNYVAVGQHYLPFLGLVSALVLFAVLMPLCGFCYCCCRCCCSGNKLKPINKRRDLCKKILYASFLIVFATLFLFGIVCAFWSNEHLHGGTNDLTKSLRVNIKDTKAYIEETKGHINVLLDANYKKLDGALKKTLDSSTQLIFDNLQNLTNATSIEEVSNVVKTMRNVNGNLDDLKVRIKNLRNQASQLNDATRKVKKDLLESLQKCQDVTKCRELQNDYVNKLGTDIDFNTIPDLSPEFKNISDFLQSGIINDIEKGQSKLQELKKQIKEQSKLNIENVKAKIDDTANNIKRKKNDILKSVDRQVKELDSNADEGLKQADKYLLEYGRYPYYVDLGVSCVFLFIAICLTLGLICGICGKKPTGYDDDCCNKGVGSTFLMCGVSIMFLTSIIMAAILIVHLSAMFVHVLVCEPLRDPQTNAATLRFYNDVATRNNIVNKNTNLGDLLAKIYRNESIYRAFRLKDTFDVAELKDYIEKYEIRKQLENLKNEIQLDTHGLILLNENSLNELRQFSKGVPELTDKFDKTVEEIERSNFTTVSLEMLIQQLDQLGDYLQSAQLQSVASELKLTKLHLEAYNDKLFIPMRTNAEHIIQAIRSMKEDLKFGKATFQEALEDLANKIEEAQDELKNRENIIKVIDTFGNKTVNAIQRFLDLVALDFSENLGKTGPVSLVLNSTLTSTCDKIVLPMTGFGVSMLWCIILFIPTIFFSVKLAHLYEKVDATYSQYIETEYLYDAYADRESIPLARGKYGGKKKHKKKLLPQDGRPTGSAYVHENALEAGRDYPVGSQHDARYADMAPKHFEDFPNGGPPQYHRATEYERPPPYYCPGSADQR